MRISNHTRQVIREAVTEIFGPDASVYLFGSRTNDKARGGDIDLFIETDTSTEEAMDKELALHARLMRRLGEQRIDIVVHRVGTPLLAIHKIARQTGERL